MFARAGSTHRPAIASEAPRARRRALNHGGIPSGGAAVGWAVHKTSTNTVCKAVSCSKNRRARSAERSDARIRSPHDVRRGVEHAAARRTIRIGRTRAPSAPSSGARSSARPLSSRLDAVRGVADHHGGLDAQVELAEGRRAPRRDRASTGTPQRRTAGARRRRTAAARRRRCAPNTAAAKARSDAPARLRTARRSSATATWTPAYGAR
jgi:hypothetical protein